MQAKAPRSMKGGQRGVLRSNDSVSLWNCTLSPGWTREESDTFRQALLFFGIGNWHKVLESGCLPGKTNAQLNLQLQRLLGQQSTAEFQGLHIDPAMVGAINALRKGPNIKRKNGFIVNTGSKMSKDTLKQRILENKERYEVPESVWKAIVLPKTNLIRPSSKIELLEAKQKELKRLQTELEQVRFQIELVEAKQRASEARSRLDQADAAALGSEPGSADEKASVDVPKNVSTPCSGADVASSLSDEPVQDTELLSTDTLQPSHKRAKFDDASGNDDDMIDVEF
eukprot:jgi/Hompol1/2366/HPOL_002920-RA